MKTSLKVISCMAALAFFVSVQSAKAAADQEIKTPNLIKLSGTAKDPNGLPKAGTLQIKFGLYASKEGGNALWNETQVVTTDADGNYSVYLGASEEKGLPLELFSAEKARWLGVQVEGEEEQSRVLFVAVPYALKALDAETVGGKPLSSFVLYEDLEKLAEDSTGQGGEATDEDGNGTGSNRTAGAINLLKSTNLHGGDRERSMQAVINGTGVANALAKFNDSDNITASVLSEVGGNIGVGTLVPYAKLTFAYNSTTTDPIAMMDSAVGGRNWRFGGGVGAPGAFTIRDDTAGANRFSITSNGNIGVGTASPVAKFSFEYDSSVVDPIAMLDTAVGGRNWRLGGGVGAAGTFTIRDDTAGANRLSISAGGNVGIGTTAPSQQLEVAGNVKVNGSNGLIFPDGTNLASADAARNRAITYLAGCDTCSALADTDDQRTIYFNLVGPMTINSVTCFSDAGTPTINLQRDSGGLANILSSNLACSTTGTTSTGIVPAQNTLNLSDKVDFVVVSAGGVAKRVTVAIKAIVN